MFLIDWLQAEKLIYIVDYAIHLLEDKQLLVNHCNNNLQSEILCYILE